MSNHYCDLAIAITIKEVILCLQRIEEDGTQDFYWDTQFETREEAEEWGVNHTYDTVTGTFESIF